MTNAQNNGVQTPITEIRTNGTSYEVPEELQNSTPDEIASVFAELGISLDNQRPVFSSENPSVLQYEAPRGQNG